VAGKFRVDFLIAAMMENGDFAIGIECDGHDYHDRTKEQAARDKKRDRAIKLAGWEIIRFTGSEIIKDARSCAKEVMHQLIAMSKRCGNG
jgi:very-short-patch-repair endonuclease